MAIRRPGVIAGTFVSFAATWLFRWLTVDFTNDHFAHLSRSRQILLGEVPVRDFFDSGSLLHYYASAAALDLAGQNLLGEALLTVTAVAIAAALTFYLSARGSQSLVVATLATVTAVALFPRLYNYPKLLLYPLALLLVWRYAARRTTGALGALAVVPALAFLFRHDHGVYIGLASLTAVILAHRDRWSALPTAVARFVVIIVALVLPYLVFVQWAGGIDRYFGGIAGQGMSAMTPRLLRLPLAVDTLQPWFVIDPPSPPRISIRWQPDVDGATRLEHERRYGLTDRTADGRYVLTDTTPGNIKALVADPLVVDTHNIDRDQFRVIVRESWLQRARNATPLLRVRVLSNVFTSANALALLYYAIQLVPLAGIATLVWVRFRGPITPFDLTTIGAAVVMCAAMNQGLIRESPDSRLGDVVNASAILVAWISGLLWRVSPARTVRPRLRVVSSVVKGVSWLVVVWCAFVFGQTGERLQASGILAGPQAAVSRFTEMQRMLQLRPIDYYAPEGSTGIQALTRYVQRCTRPSDRLLVTWFEPQVFFYAERPFAGGQTYLDAPWHASIADQQLTVSRLRRQRVPIVLTSAIWEPGFHRGFPLVREYVAANYVEAGRSGFGAGGEFAVFVKRDLVPTGMYEPFPLPCYR